MGPGLHRGPLRHPLQRLGAQREHRLVLTTDRAPDRDAAVWVVAGAPGAGKSTLAAVLARLLDPHPAVLDKDTLFSGFVAEVLAAHGRDHGEREGGWYDEHVKRHEYAGMAAAAAQIRGAGCPVVLVAPYTGQLRDPDRWAELVAAVGGEPVHLLWTRSDADTLRRRLLGRGRSRDAGKLATFDAFVARVAPQTPPVVPHHAVDCRDDAPGAARQLRALGVVPAGN